MLYICILCCVSLLAIVSGKNVDFESYVLAQIWPESACLRFAKNTKGTCHVPKSNYWTMHGLWPSNPRPPYPFNCTPSHKFDLGKIEVLLPTMVAHWPNIYYDSKNAGRDSFWKHEYEKHGTCTESQPLLADEYHYFSQALYLAGKYHFTKILSDYNIQPSSKPQNLIQFKEAFKSATGHVPQFNCLHDDKGVSYLEEIRLYLDKTTFKAIDIPTMQTFDSAGLPTHPRNWKDTFPTDQPVPVPGNCNLTVIYHASSPSSPTIGFAVLAVGYLISQLLGNWFLGL